MKDKSHVSLRDYRFAKKKNGFVVMKLQYDQNDQNIVSERPADVHEIADLMLLLSSMEEWKRNVMNKHPELFI